MTTDLTPAAPLSIVAGYGLATRRGILNSTADKPVTTMASPMGAVR